VDRASLPANDPAQTTIPGELRWAEAASDAVDWQTH
jgi:hypothetical protein